MYKRERRSACLTGSGDPINVHCSTNAAAVSISMRCPHDTNNMSSREVALKACNLDVSFVFKMDSTRLTYHAVEFSGCADYLRKLATIFDKPLFYLL